MGQKDELDFERMESLASGFGWETTKKEIEPTELKMSMKKLRVEPETDITTQPT